VGGDGRGGSGFSGQEMRRSRMGSGKGEKES